MELVEKTQTAEETPNLREALKNVIEQNPNGGEITLNEFEKLVPHSTRSECVRVLKRSGAGVFITGRRGKLSRFVYGPPAIPFLTRTNSAPRHQPAPRTRPQPQPAVQAAPAVETPKTRTQPQEVSGSALQTARFELRVGIGDQVTTIPIRIEVGIAA
jgi:hypothetical protein